MYIDNINYPAPKQEYKVLVRCATYNHSKYIEDALNGFAMQQTNFPFVCLVMDDASTDGEQDVIRAWMERECDMSRAETIDISTSVVIIVPHMTNNSCTFAFYFLKQNLYGTGKKTLYVNPWRENCKYEAMCEGDDYWIDPYKLQLQVDFLDSNLDYAFCCHRFSIYEQNTGRWLKEYAYDYYKDNSDLLITSLLFSKVWVTQPLTMMTRVSNLRKIDHDFSQYKYKRDVHMFYLLLKIGKGISLNRNMGVYRWHDGGIASSFKGLDRYLQSYEIYKELYYKTNDNIFRVKLTYYIIRILRFTPFSSKSISLLFECWSMATTTEKINAVISFITPKFLIEYLSNKYSIKYKEKMK